MLIVIPQIVGNLLYGLVGEVQLALRLDNDPLADQVGHGLVKVVLGHFRQGFGAYVEQIGILPGRVHGLVVRLNQVFELLQDKGLLFVGASLQGLRLLLGLGAGGGDQKDL